MCQSESDFAVIYDSGILKTVSISESCCAVISEGMTDYIARKLYGRGSMAKIELEERDGVVGKVCTGCRRWLPLGAFNKNTCGLGDKRSKCKSCEKKYRDEDRISNSKRCRIYYRENKGSILKHKKKYREENKEKVALWSQRRRTRSRSLPSQSVQIIEQSMIKKLTCEINNKVHLDHVIPVSIGHGGTIAPNLAYMSAELNISKSNRNIFEWFTKEKERFNLDQNEFDELIAHLAHQNGLTPSEYREFVDWCHENPRTLDGVKADKRHSIEIWREQAGRPFPLPSYTTTYYSNEVSDERQVG